MNDLYIIKTSLFVIWTNLFSHIDSILSHPSQFTPRKGLLVCICHMAFAVLLSFAHFVANRTRVCPTNRVLPLDVTPHIDARIATEKADETRWCLHHQALAYQFFCKKYGLLTNGKKLSDRQ